MHEHIWIDKVKSRNKNGVKRKGKEKDQLLYYHDNMHLWPVRMFSTNI